MRVEMIGRICGGEQHVVTKLFQSQGYLHGDGGFAHSSFAHRKHHAFARVVDGKNKVVKGLVPIDALGWRCLNETVCAEHFADIVHSVYVVGAQGYI